MRYKRQFPAKNEDGLVALLVVGIMIILLSLTTVAFTKLMGRESRQALDRQLSTQAYYSAASGINDARDYFNSHPNALLPGNNCNTLATQGYPPFLGPNSTDDVNKVTCVVGDTTPQQLFFPIDNGKSKIFEISSASDIGSVLFSWDNQAVGGYDFRNYKSTGATNFLTANQWNAAPAPAPAPVLELTYYPMPDNATNLTSLYSRAHTIYLYPARGAAVGGASTYNSSLSDGRIVTTSCQSSPSLSAATFPGATSVYHCNTVVKPTIFPALGPQTNPKNIFVKVTAFYGSAYLAVRANTTGGSPIAIKNAQVVLDSTGKGGSDVLKRLQTIVDYRPNDVEPGNVIETIVGLCKRLEYNLTTNQAQIEDPNYDPDTSPACLLN